MKLPLRRPRPSDTRQAYLDRLAKRLLPCLPASQVREILSDYQERFQAGGEQGLGDAEVIASLGSPGDAAARLLEEAPPSGLLRYYLPRGALLALCLTFLWAFVLNPYPDFLAWLCGCLFLPMAAGTVFSLLRGGARLELENQFPPEAVPSRKALFGVPLAVAVVFETGHQLWTAAVLRDPSGAARVTPMRIGECNRLLCLGLALAMALLALWWLFRSVTGSIRYFPGFIHALGLSLAGVTTLVPFLSSDVGSIRTARDLSLAMLLYFLPYLAGLATALVFQRWLDGGLPAWFRQPEGGQRDYLDRLGKCLLRVFPAGQVCEVLEDYREQFELGLERGRTESALAEELGRPEAVARDVAAESPLLRRAARRRNALWTLLLLPAAWVMLGMFLRFEYGDMWLLWPDLAPAFLALGAVAMFALLRGPDRARVEARFPPERGGVPAWAFALPLADLAVEAAGLWYILRGDSWYADSGVTPTAMAAICFTEASVLLLAALLVWTLSRSFSRSVRYFPAAVQAAGAAMSSLKLVTAVRHTDLSGGSPTAADCALSLLIGLFPYLASLALAAVFGAVLWACARRGKEG